MPRISKATRRKLSRANVAAVAAESPEKRAARLSALARGHATQARLRAERNEVARLAALSAGASDPATPRPPATPPAPQIPDQSQKHTSGLPLNFSEKSSGNEGVEKAGGESGNVSGGGVVGANVGEDGRGAEKLRGESTGIPVGGDLDKAKAEARAFVKGFDAAKEMEGETQKISAEKSAPDGPSAETPIRDNARPKENAKVKEPESPKVVYRRAKLYPAQSACFFGPERWSWTEGTTKAGKTAGLIVWLCEQAIFGKPDQNFWWVAPVAPVAAIAYRRMCKAIPYDLRTTHDTLQRITLVNGAHIWFKSAEKPDNLYGEDVYAAAIDECSRVREDSWFAVRTTLSATKGKCRGIGNVKGRRNWFYKLCRRAEAKATTDSAYHKLTWRNAVAAGILDVAEVEDARAMLPPAVFQELYEAEASDDTGCPFGIQAIADCVAPMSKNPVVCWGWDFARKRDWFVGVGLDYVGDVAAFERWQMPWQQAIPLCRDKTNRVPALVDSTGIGDVIIAALAAGPGNFEGYVFTPRSKQDLMEALAIDIQMRKGHFPDGPLRNELESFEYEYQPNGRATKYSAPEGMFDDCVCAYALARAHWKAGHGSVGGLAGNGAGYARLPAFERSSVERGYGSREILIG